MLLYDYKKLARNQTPNQSPSYRCNIYTNGFLDMLLLYLIILICVWWAPVRIWHVCNKLIKKGLVHATLCDGPQKQVSQYWELGMWRSNLMTPKSMQRKGESVIFRKQKNADRLIWPLQRSFFSCTHWQSNGIFKLSITITVLLLLYCSGVQKVCTEKKKTFLCKIECRGGRGLNVSV